MADTVNAPSRARVLLIEDEPKTARAVLNGLKAEGFAPGWAETGEDGFFLLSSEHFDAVVLDWMLPGRSGLEVLKKGLQNARSLADGPRRSRGSSCWTR